jgi:membrane carboxypeptidase/penicillin-binding protein PbpC
MTEALRYLYDLINSNIVVLSAAALHEKVDVPEHFLKYLFLIEDKRFNLHVGIDPIAIARASINNFIYHGLYEGASTITQQLYSTNLEARGERYNRKFNGKLKQILWSVHKEITSSKPEILLEYLETIYWGRDYYGLDQATAGYFNIEKGQLSYEQSFFLAERIAWPNIVSSDRIKQLISTPQMATDFNDFERLKRLSTIYNQIFQCKENICLTLVR